MLEKYPGKVKVVFKHYPLRSHRFSTKAALAAIAAQNQGKFWPFHEKLFDNHLHLTDELIDETARDLNLDMAQYQKDMQDPKTAERLRRDISDAKEAGVSAVPAVFVNGKVLKNRHPKSFETAIERALEASGGGAES